LRYLLIPIIFIFIFFSCTPKVVKEPPPKVEQPDIKYLWAYKKTVNVRTGNSATSSKLASLSDGDSVKILQNENGWYEVILDNGTKGWIRSDLLGTKNMSTFSKAIAFSENLKENEKINLYFDKKIQHKRIFLEFPQSEYSSKKNIENKTKEIGKKYQDTVYPGKVTIQVIEPKNQIEYLTINLPGASNADLILPVIKFGILEEFKVAIRNELKLVVLVNENIENALLLKEARKIAGSFPLTLKKVNITFKNKSKKCILSFVEDAFGEHYKFNFCL
jgi:SH3 domain-containing protein